MFRCLGEPEYEHVPVPSSLWCAEHAPLAASSPRRPARSMAEEVRDRLRRTGMLDEGLPLWWRRP